MNTKIKFKVGNQVIVDYFHDNYEHNGEIGTISHLYKHKYYPNGNYSVVERKMSGFIKYKNGDEVPIFDFYRKGSGVVSPIRLV